MKIRPAKIRSRAFTIVEVLMSILIIGISAAGLMGCFRFSMFAIRMARENQRATQIVLERTEAIRCYRWDDLGNVPTSTLDYYNSATSEKPIYTVQTTLSAFSPSGGSPTYADKMQQLTIIVSWQSWGVTRNRTNITYIAKDGIQNYVF